MEFTRVKAHRLVFSVQRKKKEIFIIQVLNKIYSYLLRHIFEKNLIVTIY